jgi:hypothetical protein
MRLEPFLRKTFLPSKIKDNFPVKIKAKSFFSLKELG